MTGSASPCSGTSASRRVARRPIPCQAGRKRPSAACSAGSTSRRSAASEARRSRRSTSGSHHSRSVPPGRSSPRTSRSARSSSCSSASSSSPNRVVGLGGRERAATLRVAEHELAERVRAALEERLGQAAGRHHAERVAVAAGILGGDQPLLAGDPGSERAPLGEQDRGLALVVLAGAQVAAAAEDVVQLVGVARVAAKLPLDLGERVGVDQLAQLLLPEQLAQEVAVERERLRAALGRRRVVLVHVGGDVVEEERAGERRGRRRLDLDEVELARLQAREDALQRGQVEDVLQALAVGLEHDRERAVLARDLEQVLRLQPLLPERRPLAGAAARDQQRPSRVLAEAGAEEGGLAHLPDDELLDLVRSRSAGRRGSAARRPRAGGARSRRPTRSTARRARASRAAARSAPSPTAHARGRRTGSGCRRASRRSRRGSARRRSSGRRGRPRSRPPARAGT